MLSESNAENSLQLPAGKIGAKNESVQRKKGLNIANTNTFKQSGPVETPSTKKSGKHYSLFDCEKEKYFPPKDDGRSFFCLLTFRLFGCVSSIRA